MAEPSFFATTTGPREHADLSSSTPARAFRADTDQAGEWYVWTRLSTLGWATMQRCENRELAQRLADDLNQRSLRVAV